MVPTQRFTSNHKNLSIDLVQVRFDWLTEFNGSVYFYEYGDPSGTELRVNRFTPGKGTEMLVESVRPYRGPIGIYANEQLLMFAGPDEDAFRNAGIWTVNTSQSIPGCFRPSRSYWNQAIRSPSNRRSIPCAGWSGREFPC